MVATVNNLTSTPFYYRAQTLNSSHHRGNACQLLAPRLPMVNSVLFIIYEALHNMFYVPVRVITNHSLTLSTFSLNSSSSTQF